LKQSKQNPARANAALICLVDLHLEGGACVPSVEANDFKPKIAEFMHEPRRHRSGFNPHSCVSSRMPSTMLAADSRGASAPRFQNRLAF
jgi:hypothetical protein